MIAAAWYFWFSCSKIKNNNKYILEIMNVYYINVAEDGIKILILQNTLTLLNKTALRGQQFSVSSCDLLTILKTLNPEKAAGFDLIPVKLLKHAFYKLPQLFQHT